MGSFVGGKEEATSRWHCRGVQARVSLVHVVNEAFSAS